MHANFQVKHNHISCPCNKLNYEFIHFDRCMGAWFICQWDASYGIVHIMQMIVFSGAMVYLMQVFANNFWKKVSHSKWFGYVCAFLAVGKVWYVFKTQNSTSWLLNLCLDLDLYLYFQAFFSICSGSFCRHGTRDSWLEQQRLQKLLDHWSNWKFGYFR